MHFLRKLFAVQRHVAVLLNLVRIMVRHRELTLTLAWQEIRERHVGQFFGMAWSVILPAFLMAIYIFAFVYIFKGQLSDDVGMNKSYAEYLISGLLGWLVVSDGIIRGVTMVTSNATLVKQVVFPIEILPLKSVLATLFSHMIFVVIFIAYAVIKSGTILPTYGLVPVLLAIVGLGLSGAGFIISAISVFVRDVREVVGVLTAAGIYMTPVLYPPGMLSPPVEAALNLNPLSHLIHCYHDALFYGTFVHPWSWLISAMMSLILFYLGFRLFRRLSHGFGEHL